MDEVSRLQQHLYLIRCCAGWTAAALAEKLGVKRQTISTIERGEEKYKMTRMQYLAIRKVLDDEIASSSEDDTRMLKLVIDALVDHPDAYSSEERTKILSEAKLLAPAIVKSPSERSNVSGLWVSLITVSVAAMSAALIAIINSKKD